MLLFSHKGFLRALDFNVSMELSDKHPQNIADIPLYSNIPPGRLACDRRIRNTEVD